MIGSRARDSAALGPAAGATRPNRHTEILAHSVISAFPSSYTFLAFTRERLELKRGLSRKKRREMQCVRDGV